MPALSSKARKTLGTLRAIRDELRSINGESIRGGRGAGVGRRTDLALGGIAGGVQRIEKLLKPSAADKRSIL